MKRLLSFGYLTECLFFRHSGNNFSGTIFCGLLITLKTNTQYIAQRREKVIIFPILTSQLRNIVETYDFIPNQL